MEEIVSRANERIKQAAFLAERREREQKRRFCFEGVHLLEEYLKSGKTPCELFVTREALGKYGEILANCAGKVTLVSESVYSRLSAERAPQGIFCVAEYLDNVKENTVPPGGSVILESVRDAGNLGGMIRTAAALGINCVALTRDCADIYSYKTVRASMGALFTSEIIVLDDAVSAVKAMVSSGKNVYAACLYGETRTLGTFVITKEDSFVFGNEGAGISGPLASACTSRVIIPMSGRTESLNVAAASAVIMWEMVRSRG
ncbi:MAG: RNA methyltransferase [Clostridia bacterium]|nr:RNA methyltransferase [Clostridia bacterium]